MAGIFPSLVFYCTVFFHICLIAFAHNGSYYANAYLTNLINKPVAKHTNRESLHKMAAFAKLDYYFTSFILPAVERPCIERWWRWWHSFQSQLVSLYCQNRPVCLCVPQLVQSINVDPHCTIAPTKFRGYLLDWHVRSKVSFATSPTRKHSERNLNPPQQGRPVIPPRELVNWRWYWLLLHKGRIVNKVGVLKSIIYCMFFCCSKNGGGINLCHVKNSSVCVKYIFYTSVRNETS